MAFFIGNIRNNKKGMTDSGSVLVLDSGFYPIIVSAMIVTTKR